MRRKLLLPLHSSPPQTSDPNDSEWRSDAAAEKETQYGNAGESISADLIKSQRSWRVARADAAERSVWKGEVCVCVGGGQKNISEVTSEPRARSQLRTHKPQQGGCGLCSLGSRRTAAALAAPRLTQTHPTLTSSALTGPGRLHMHREGPGCCWSVCRLRSWLWAKKTTNAPAKLSSSGWGFLRRALYHPPHYCCHNI